MTEYMNAESQNMPNTAKVKGVVDLCFLLDATGSMQPCINDVKQNIRTFIQKLLSPDANGGVIISNWRACVCAYRDALYDPSHGREWIEMNPFTDDVDELYRQLDVIKAEGGGDEPESLLDALYAVIGRGKTEKGQAPEPDKWRYASAAARCIIVLTDASFHPTLADSDAGVGDIINLIQQERVRLSLFAPEMVCHYELSAADRCSYDAIELPEGDDSPKAAQRALQEYTGNVENFSKVLELLVKSVSQSGAVDVEQL